jgi:hypothetical protein
VKGHCDPLNLPSLPYHSEEEAAKIVKAARKQNVTISNFVASAALKAADNRTAGVLFGDSQGLGIIARSCCEYWLSTPLPSTAVLT